MSITRILPCLGIVCSSCGPYAGCVAQAVYILHVQVHGHRLGFIPCSVMETYCYGSAYAFRRTIIGDSWPAMSLVVVLFGGCVSVGVSWSRWLFHNHVVYLMFRATVNNPLSNRYCVYCVYTFG